MNRIRLSLVAVITALTIGVGQVNAQEKPITLGVKAGVNLSTFGGDMKDTKSTFKYQAGITADIKLTQNFYVLTGLEFQTKGAKYQPKSEADVKYDPMYLQLPAHLGYKIQLLPGIKFVANVGPYVAYGIGGKAKGGGNSEKIFGDNKFNRLDYGVSGGIGFEFGKICVNGGYDFGLKDVSDMKSFDIKNRNAYLTLGYKF